MDPISLKPKNQPGTKDLVWWKYFLLLFTIVFYCSTVVTSKELPEAGGSYYGNHSLLWMNGPYKATKPIIVHPGANLTIQEGVEIQFDPGVGIVVQGVLHAVGYPNFRIRLVPRRMTSDLQLKSSTRFPKLRLVDGPTTKQGRLQILSRGRWRAVCTMNTNWTDTDMSTACRSLGFSSGGFFRWFRRNNDTFPFVMPRPRCEQTHADLFQCNGFIDENRIPLAENLCRPIWKNTSGGGIVKKIRDILEGEDDIGLWCWGPPTFPGWDSHWMGLQFLDAQRELVYDDPHGVAVMRRSNSRLEWVDILYAGWDREIQNTTSGLYVRGTPPLINYVDVLYSAGDGIRVFEADGPLELTNSTISYNRGHGVCIDNTTDGRVFINDTYIQYNWGDGIKYSMKLGVLFASSPLGNNFRDSYTNYFEDRPEFNFCTMHSDPLSRRFYPRLLEAFLVNGTLLGADKSWPCHVRLDVPDNRPYTFTVQFLEVTNQNAPQLDTNTTLILCERGAECAYPKFTIPIHNGILSPSVVLQNTGYGLWLGLKHEGAPDNNVAGNIRVVLRVFAMVKDQVMYGLNISNSRITHNFGNGVFLHNLRDRLVINNASLSFNQHIAGLHVLGGAGDIWVNWTRIEGNWGDGINISYVGGSTFINGTLILNNRWRGAAFHYNASSSPFLALQQQIVFRGRQANSDYLPTSVSGNGWGGILVGNFCRNSLYSIDDARVSVSFASLNENKYHPGFEFLSCQRDNEPVTAVEVIGSECARSDSMCIRIQPAVNLKFTLRASKFLENSRPTVIVRNREHPQLSHLPAEAVFEFNEWTKNNVDQFVANLGLHEGATHQRLILDQQNHFRNNRVRDPFPWLNPRGKPFAVLVLSSSNAEVHQTCFDDPESEFELATDLDQHSRVINAQRNSWGGSSKDPKEVLLRIFDSRKRFNLASLNVDPYLRYCNFLNNDKVTPMLGYFLPWRLQQNEIGGQIVERSFLPKGRYKVVDDIHILPGASLDIDPGTVLEFEDSVAMLVQGELRRGGSNFDDQAIVFTSSAVKLPSTQNIRIASETIDVVSVSGRLEVLLNDQWGTVCNRSWNVGLAKKACNQMGMFVDPEFLENWWTFPDPGELPIVVDIIRCEELETDITSCRHDGPLHNVNVSCRATDVVGIRCLRPRWGGVRYSLLANPPITTGQEYVHHIVVEKAGLFDYAKSQFSAAMQVDWNYHTFRGLTIRDNLYNGLDIIYNDLIRKPKLVESKFSRNRRNGIQARSYGLSMENIEISDNENAGFRYDPLLSAELQEDIVSWLDTSNLAFNNIVNIPNSTSDMLTLDAGDQTSGRRFLVARNTKNCGLSPERPCAFDLRVLASNIQNSMTARIGIQIVNRPSNLSDEDIIFVDGDKTRGKQWSVRNDLISFPIVTQYNQLLVQYRKSYGPAAIVILLFFMDNYQYLDPFIHMRHSVVSGNQYGVSTVHYSNFSYSDGSQANRYDKEQFWFQKTNFSANRQAVIWVNSPLRDVQFDTPISVIEYFVDNCTVSYNNGSIIHSHRDLYSSANVFHWKFWWTLFHSNDRSGISLTLPDSYNNFASKLHRVELMECDFSENTDFSVDVDGYFTWANISANNFTHNRATFDEPLMRISGMEKQLIFERNRFIWNRARYVVLIDIQRQTLKMELVQARMRFNVLDQNYYLSADALHVDNFPRSFALGLLGLQKVNITYNYLRNPLVDFEAVIGLRGSQVTDFTNASLNYWGVSTGTEVAQRIFDYDDWNIYSVAEFNPFFVNDIIDVISWWWLPEKAQTNHFYPNNPSVYDLKGRLFDSVTLERRREKWTTFPYYYKPDKPYIIRRDLTIMPGATLTIEKGVEVHLYPNVRILVLGSLVAEGTYYEPIRLRPINITEAEASDPGVLRLQLQQLQHNTAAIRGSPRFTRHRRDLVYRKFPLLNREDPSYQRFDAYLLDGREKHRGFLEIWNATSGEMVPICDRQFSQRNAQVVCRELGFKTNENAYVWIGPRWERDPKLHIVKFYSEPRQCSGSERRLSDCDLRPNNDPHLWRCIDAEHFVFVHCGASSKLDHGPYVAPWGGITFSTASVDQWQTPKASVLRFVEIVGAGFAHNESGSALEMVYQTPVLENVNVTNSSLHAITVIAPRGSVNLRQVNVTHNSGIGLNVLTLNLQRTGDTTNPVRNLTIPYHIYGLVEMCSIGKEVIVENRVLVYFKYDNFPVDCVKIFRSRDSTQKLGWKFLQANLYSSGDSAVGRDDSLRFFSSDKFDSASQFAFVHRDSSLLGATKESSSSVLGVYLRANAADVRFGFIAEVVVLPFPMETGSVQDVSVVESRFEYNDRGAIQYSSMGEQSPNFVMDTCYIGHNGINVWGNFSTAQSAVKLDLHNTQSLKVYNSVFWRNQGGLHIDASSSTAIARLEGVIRNSAFSHNENFETLSLNGRDYQKMFIVNCYFGKNFAPYRDIVHVRRLISNFTHNIFYNNTGQHIVDLMGSPRQVNDHQHFSHNFLFDNIAFGHGYQFNESFGFFPPAYRVFSPSGPRRRRQTTEQDSSGSSSGSRQTSFEWWANIGSDGVDRYRSTVLCGTSQQRFERNYFVNPYNDFELTTVNKSQFDLNPLPIDARGNYWGFPGTVSVAAGRIRDQEDYAALLPVEFRPSLESNTSLLEGDCPPGWFQTGQEEPTRIKACFLYIGGAMPYKEAVQFCRDNDAYMPYFRNQDPRLDAIASKITDLNRRFMTSFERYYVPLTGNNRDVRIWIGGVMVPPEQCGFLSSLTARIGFYNCDMLLPFVCEKDPDVIKDAFFLRPAGIAAFAVAGVVFVLIVFLIVLWWLKSKRRKQEHFERKNSLRDSMRRKKLQKLQRETLGSVQKPPVTVLIPQPPPQASPDLIRRGLENILRPSTVTPVKKKTSPSLDESIETRTETSSISDSSPSQHSRNNSTQKRSKLSNSVCSESAYKSGSSDYTTSSSTNTGNSTAYPSGRQTNKPTKPVSSLLTFRPLPEQPTAATVALASRNGTTVEHVALRKKPSAAVASSYRRPETQTSTEARSSAVSTIDSSCRTSEHSTVTDDEDSCCSTARQSSSTPESVTTSARSSTVTSNRCSGTTTTTDQGLSTTSLSRTSSSIIDSSTDNRYALRFGGRSRAPVYRPGSDMSFSEETRSANYSERLTPARQATIAQQQQRIYTEPVQRPQQKNTGAFPNVSFIDSSVSTDSLIAETTTSRSGQALSSLESALSVPNLNAFARSSGIGSSKPLPLETAM